MKEDNSHLHVMLGFSVIAVSIIIAIALTNMPSIRHYRHNNTKEITTTNNVDWKNLTLELYVGNETNYTLVPTGYKLIKSIKTNEWSFIDSEGRPCIMTFESEHLAIKFSHWDAYWKSTWKSNEWKEIKH